MQKKLADFELIRWEPALHLLAGVVMIVIAILFSDIPRMILSQGWPTTDGTILYHKFVGVKFKEYDGSFYTKIDVYIRYEYSVDGITYSSLSIDSLDAPCSPTSSLDAPCYPSSYASRFPVGGNVIVYYNPKNPADAVLEPGLVNIFKAFGGFSFLFLLAGVFFIFLGILQRKKIRDRDVRKKLMEKYMNQ